MRNSLRLLLLASVVLAIGTMSYAGPPPIIITPIVYQGFNVPGVGNISGGFGASERHAVNDLGDWLVRADTDAATTEDQVVLQGFQHSTGSLLLREDQPVPPPGARLSSVDSLYINNSGNMSFNFFLRGTQGSFDDSGVYFNDQLIIQESDTVTAPGVSPNTPWIGFFETRINNSNTILVMGSMNDAALPTSVDRILALVDPFTFQQSVVAMESTLIVTDPGPVERRIENMGTGTHHMALNDNGHVLFTVDMDGSTADDGGVVLWDGTNFNLVMREGSPSPIPGRNWQATPTAVDLNNSGDWVARGDLDGSTADDSVIVKNGSIILAREGFSIPAISPWNFQTFGSGGVAIDDNGNVVWYGDWDDPDTSRDKGLFWNDQLLVQIGVTQIQDGRTVTAISAVSENISLSNNGQWLIFEGTVSDGVTSTAGAFLIEIIPEPGALTLMMLGLTIVGIRRRR